MVTPERTEFIEELLRPSDERRNILRERDEWKKRHTVAAGRIAKLADSFAFQPEDRQRRITELVVRLMSRR